MELNSLIFPSPKASYTKNHNDLIYVEKKIYNYSIRSKQRIQGNYKIKASINSTQTNQYFSFETPKKTKSCNSIPEINVSKLSTESNSDNNNNEFNSNNINSNFNTSRSGVSQNSPKNQLQTDRSDIINQNEFDEKTINLSNVEKNTPTLQLPATLKKKSSEKQEEQKKIIDQIKNQIQSKSNSHQKSNYSNIPCIFLPHKQGSDKILLYFHGNAEDLGQSVDFLNQINKQLKVNVLAVEYPGYGIYQGEPNEEQMLEDAEIIYDYINYIMKIESKNIIILGKSLGTGPAIHLSALKNPSSCILISPYTSIRGVVEHKVGLLLSYTIAERFRNIDKISQVRCPTLFIHGLLDTLIPHKQSQELMDKCSGITQIKIQEKMSHNEFDIIYDLIIPMKEFLIKCGINILSDKNYIDEFSYKSFTHMLKLTSNDKTIINKNILFASQ